MTGDPPVTAILTDGTPLTIEATIVKNDGPGCLARSAPAIADGGGNVRTPGSGCPGADGDAGLRPLQDNAGPVPTRAPTPGGPAIDALSADCPATDARGLARPFGAACDAGAYELAAPGATTGGNTGSTVAGTVNMHGPAGTAHFEYGPPQAYGTSTPDQAIGKGFDDHDVSADLGSIPSGTTVHYRVVATTPDGTSAGADHTITTASPRGQDRTRREVPQDLAPEVQGRQEGHDLIHAE